jgi:hypothetical protein
VRLERARVLALEHRLLTVEAELAQARAVEPGEAERVLGQREAQALHGVPDRPTHAAEVLAPVLARPHLVPVDHQAVSVERPEQRRHQQVEVRKRRGVHHVVAPPAQQQVQERAQPEHQRLGYAAPPALHVQGQAWRNGNNLDARHTRIGAAGPLPARQVGHLVPVGREAFGEVPVPPFRSSHGMGIEAVVDDADAHDYRSEVMGHGS